MLACFLATDRDKLTSTTAIREANNLTKDSYVFKEQALGNTMTVLKASAKFKRKMKQKQKQQQEDIEERELEATGSFFGLAASGSEKSVGSVATSPTSMALPPASPVVTATSAVVPAENTKKLESQVEMLTAQIGQLHGMMLQMLDNQEGAAMGALAFRMP